MNVGAVTVTGSAALINGITGPGTLIIGNGSVSSLLQFAPNSGASSESSLTINTNSTLDIDNNSLTINYGSNADPKTTILGYLASGADDGVWDGTGIDCVEAGSTSKYGVGYADGADGIDPGLTSGELVVAYVQYGDITLQGLVDAEDFTILASNFSHIVTGGWEDGDFLYQGVVNAEDFHLLSENFGLTETGEDIATPAEWAAVNAFATANGLAVGNVPEPSGMLGLATLGLLARRRRKR